MIERKRRVEILIRLFFEKLYESNSDIVPCIINKADYKQGYE